MTKDGEVYRMWEITVSIPEEDFTEEEHDAIFDRVIEAVCPGPWWKHTRLSTALYVWASTPSEDWDELSDWNPKGLKGWLTRKLSCPSNWGAGARLVSYDEDGNELKNSE